MERRDPVVTPGIELYCGSGRRWDQRADWVWSVKNLVCY